MTSEKLPFYIGRYLATGLLGSGGMGVVYLATDERLNRRVAIKRLINNPVSSSAHLRIRQEALLLAQLNHNNIVQIYDVVDERDEVALVMEYVDGCSLNIWQRERNPNLLQKLQLLKQICLGLSRAHGAGIVHRDLKAENILIDENNTPKISDFGIAKNWRENNNLTLDNHVAGSWGAMSPEQALGKPMDYRSDLFALGVLAYRLLCEQNPFGDSESPFIVADRIVNSQHPPAAKLNPALPAPLCQLLDRLLSKEPNKRPLSAASVAEDLDAIALTLNAKAASTTSCTVTITAESFHQSHRSDGHHYKWLIGTAVAAVVLLLIATASVMLPQSKGTNEGKYIAIVPPRSNVPDSHESTLLTNNVLSAIKQGLSNREGLFLIPYSESQQLGERPLRELAQALSTQLLLLPSCSCSKNTCEVSLELIETEGFSVIASRSTLLEKTTTLDSRARVMQQLNYLLPQFPPSDRDSTFNISAEDYQRYLELFEQRNDFSKLDDTLSGLEALQESNPLFPPYYALYSKLISDQRFNTNSLEAVDRLEKFLNKTPPEITDYPAVLIAELRLATYRDNPNRAESLLSQLKLILPDQATYYSLQTSYYHERGEFKKAMHAVDKALSQRTSLIYLTQKANVLTSIGDMDAANELLLQALQLSSDDNIEVISVLAANKLDSGHPAEAIRLLSKAGLERLGALDTYNLCLAYYLEEHLAHAQECMARVAERSPQDADPVLYQAEIARMQNQPERARELAQHALEITREREDWGGLLMQARAHAELGQAGRAVEVLLKIRRQAPDSLYVNYARAQVYMAAGDLITAKAQIRRTLEQGLSPIWYDTGGFSSICTRDSFADLRNDYPELCMAREKGSQVT